MDWILFLAILIQVESGGDKTAIGDRHLKNKAYGVCQIRQPYLDDVNTIAKTNYTIEQVAASETLSKWAVLTYVRYYGKRYTKLTGNPLTMEVAARIHNGGLNGWKRTSTDVYWKNFKRRIP
jgi:hypothetical protein